MKRFLTSPMFTPGVRLFAGLAVFALIGMVVTGFSTCFPAEWSWTPPQLHCEGDQGVVDSILGPLTGGWKGGVGNHIVYAVFLSVFLASTGLAGLMAAFRDADPESLAEVAHVDTAPVVEPPRHASYWPMLSAFAAGITVVGVAVNTALFIAGVFAMVLIGMEWAVRTWAENATGDPTLNEEYRERLAGVLEIPGLAAVAIGAFVMAGSRVFLAVDATAAVVIAGAAAFILLIGFSFFAYYPRAGRSVASIFVVLAGIIVIGTGIFAAALGEREFEEHHGETPHEVDADADDTGSTDEVEHSDDTTETTVAVEEGE
jgi:hypothetical protein